MTKGINIVHLKEPQWQWEYVCVLAHILTCAKKRAEGNSKSLAALQPGSVIMDSFTLYFFVYYTLPIMTTSYLQKKIFFFKATHKEKSNPAKEEKMWQVTWLLFGDWLEAVCEEVDYL